MCVGGVWVMSEDVRERDQAEELIGRLNMPAGYMHGLVFPCIGSYLSIKCVCEYGWRIL